MTETKLYEVGLKKGAEKERAKIMAYVRSLPALLPEKSEPRSLLEAFELFEKLMEKELER